MCKYRFRMTYHDNTQKELFTDTPLSPFDDLVEHACSYTSYNVETGKAVYMRFGYSHPDQLEPSWYWVMTLPMTQEELALHSLVEFTGEWRERDKQPFFERLFPLARTYQEAWEVQCQQLGGKPYYYATPKEGSTDHLYLGAKKVYGAATFKGLWSQIAFYYRVKHNEELM